MLDTSDCHQGILGLHFGHHVISLNLCVIYKQFAKEVICEARKDALRNLGFDKIFFCRLDFNESDGLCFSFLVLRND